MQRPDIKNGADVFKYTAFTKEIFLGKSTVFYGPSKTGKSYLLNEYITGLAKYFYAAIVFASTANTDKEFPMTKYTPAPLIHDGLDMGKLRAIAKAAKERMEYFQASRELENLKKSARVLRSIYKNNNAIKELSDLNRNLKSIAKYKTDNVDNCDSKASKIKAEETIIEIYLYILKRGKIFIDKNNIDITIYSNEDLLSLVFCRLNPNLLLIFNDVGDHVKGLNKSDKLFFETMFTRGRHDGLTIAYLAHSTTHLTPESRTSAHVNVFTTEDLIEEYVDRCKMKFMKRKLSSAAEAIMKPDELLPPNQKKYNKIVFSKEDSSIYYVQANKMGEQVMIGNEKMVKLLQGIQIEKRGELMQGIEQYM